MSGIAQQFGFATMPVVLESALPVHLGDDERHAVLEPESRGLVDAERARGRRGAGTSSRLVSAPTEKKQTSRSPAPSATGRRLLDLEVADPPARRAPGRERADVLVPAPEEQLERDSADRAAGPDDADRGARGQSRACSPSASELERVVQGAHRALDRVPMDVAADPDRRGRDDHRSIPCSSSVANAVAATPGWLFIPAPTTLTCPSSDPP